MPIDPIQIAAAALCLAFVYVLFLIRGIYKDLDFLFDHIEEVTESMNKVTNYVVAKYEAEHQAKNK